MQLYNRTKWWKFFLILGACGIGIFSLIYTSRLANELKVEEQKKMETWSLAYNMLINDTGSSNDIGLILQIIEDNTTIPIIVSDKNDKVKEHRNIKLHADNQDESQRKELTKMKKKYQPIIIKYSEEDYDLFYYGNSILITELKWFPIIQLLVVCVFILVAYSAFSASRRWEQDQVWVGMARETAHQLGTPASSLLGWMDIFEMKNANPEYVKEMRYDIKRLLTIIARFSKIGSQPELSPELINEVVFQMIDYLRNRTSKLVKYSIKSDVPNDFTVKISRPLFEWVIENICKNAIDAMEGEGSINIHIFKQKDKLAIDIADTGKGIARNKQKSVFKPGFSTKVAGWGLGLSLAKRIVVQYHKGKVFILSSSGKGTTFRILISCV